MIGGFVSPEVLALLFLFFGLTIAVIVKKLRSMYSFIPYTPTLFLISVGLGYFSKNMGILGESLATIAKINPRGILLIFLPPLIFQSGFNSDWYIFRKQSTQIFILAFPAVLLGASIIMISIKAIIQYDDSFYTYPQAFMFGSVLSCTDTVAVLALLKEAGAPRKFNSLIEGESLFNDGSCMVLFTISLQLVKGTIPPPLYICKLFLELTVGAVILGCVFGFISSQLINRVRNNPVLTLNITVVSCYLIYFTAEYVDLGIKISGIMALVSLGIYMAAFGKAKIAPQANQIVQNFWKIYVFIAETIIFILGGVLVGIQFLKPEFLQVLDMGSVYKLFYLYICMTLARFLSIAIFMPILRSEGYGLKWKEVGALTYGGLRGAVGIAFTLILAGNPTLQPTFRMISLFNTSGCAFLTLMINAPTCNFVIKKLGLCVKSETKTKFFVKFMTECENQLEKKLDQLSKNKHLESANWQKLRDYTGLPQLKQFITEQKSKIKSSYADIISQKQMKAIKQNLLSDNIPDQIDPALMDEARNRFCIILKGIFWSKFQDNQCSTQSIRMLTQCVNIDMDTTQEPLNSWDYLISHLDNPYFFPIIYWLKNKPIIGPYAYSLMYDRVGLLYDVISTYLEGLKQCEQACKNLPYDDYLQAKVIQQSRQNRKLAQSYLDHEIKVSYFEIMKRIQTTKAAQSILAYEKQMLEKSHEYGQIGQTFYKQILNIIEQSSMKLDKDSDFKGSMSDIDIMKENQFFAAFTDAELKRILAHKIEIYAQKDQSLVKMYEKQKFVYLVTRGEIKQQYKCEGKSVYKKNVGFAQLAGVGTLLMNHKKDLQYSANAQSVSSVFCFPILDIREIIAKRKRLEQILYLQVFMLQVSIEPDICNTYHISQETWQKKKRITNFKKLSKQEEFNVSHCQLVLAYGKIHMNDKQAHRGYFILRNQSARITGPAKFYIINEKQMMEEECKYQDNHKRDLSQEEPRMSRASRRQAKQKSDSILRRTIYNKY